MDNNVYLAYYQNTGIINIINVKIVPIKNTIMPKKKNVYIVHKIKNMIFHHISVL